MPRKELLIILLFKINLLIKFSGLQKVIQNIISSYINIFLKPFLFCLFQKKTLLLFKNTNNITLVQKKISWLLKFFKKNFSIKIPFYSLKSFINIFLMSILLKDAALIVNWLQYILEYTHFKNHRAIFSFLISFLNNFGKFILKKLNCIGLMFILVGKLGTGGSSKKKKIFFKVGRSSLNSTRLSIEYANCSIFSFSGIISLKFFIFF